MSREWATPLRDDTLRVTIVSDMHHGRRAFTPDAMAHAGASLDREAKRTDLFLDLGDSIHWRLAGTMASEDTEAKTWLAQRRTNTGKPWYSIAGNHDMQSYGSPFPNRTGDQWAADMSISERNHVIDYGDWARIILVTPEQWGYDTTKPGHEPLELSAAEVQWIEDQATSAPERVTLLGMHSPPGPHYSGHVSDATTALLHGMLGRAPNIIAFLSGHRHTDLTTDTRCFNDYWVGDRKLHWINVPSFGGVTPPTPDDRWGQPFLSTHLTVTRDGAIEVRCRDHMQSRWVPWWRTGAVTYLPPLPSLDLLAAPR